MSTQKRILPIQFPLCPLCDQNDRVEKASAIYIEGLGRAYLQKVTEGETPQRLTRLTPQEVSTLGQRLAPPAAPSRTLARPIHPDLIVAAFTLILPVFFVGIANSQRALLLPLSGLIALFYVLYLLTRSRLLERFQRQQAGRQAEAQRIEKAIRTWMSLFYCARDEVLFYPGSLRVASIDEADSLLFEERKS